MTAILPLAEYAVGVHGGECAVPDEAARYTLRIAACCDDTPDIWSDKTTLRIETSTYLDGVWQEIGPQGQRVNRCADREWVPSGAFDSRGGRHVKRDGSTMPDRWLSGPLVPLAGRRFQVRLIVLEAPVRTRVWVEFE